MKTVVTALARWKPMFWACGLAILILALMPTVPRIPTTGWDKSNHALAFSVLTFLGCRAYPDKRLLVLIGAVLYGGLIEVLQSFTPYRVAEWGDLIADSVGVIFGWVTVVLTKVRSNASTSSDQYRGPR